MATAASVAEWAADRWNIGTVTGAELIRSYVNDTYRIVSDQGEYALKMFRQSWRNRWDANWEAQFCTHLEAHGIPVAAPIAGRDREYWQLLIFPEGERAALMTPWLGGVKPKPPWTEDLYRDFGRASARMHRASMSFRPDTPGRSLNTDHMIRRPIAKLREHFDSQPETLRQLLDRANRVAAELDSLTSRLPFGVCQGDLTLDNLHILPGGRIGFYDFDLGGHGWFAFDFAFFDGWIRKDRTAVIWWNAFRAGYSEIREITETEIQAMPLFNIAYLIWDLEHTVHTWTKWSGTWRASDEKVESMVAEIFERIT